MTNSPVDPRLALGLFVAGVLLAAALFWPRRGLIARALRRLRVTDRVLAEDALKLLFHAGAPVTPSHVAATLGLPPARLERVLGRLVSSGLIATSGAGLSLSDAGRDYALHIVRAHRLWERFLADRTGVPINRWHEEAEAMEHLLTREDTAALYERMGRPSVDPHGDPIPDAGELPAPLPGIPLASVEAGRSAEIVHLEDEPDASYQRLLAAGLAPGSRLAVVASDQDGVRVRTSGRDVAILAGDVAGVTVQPVDDASAGAPIMTLADIGPGETAVVVGLAPACHGPERRRLLDLGIVPDTAVTAEFSSAMGEPIAFRIRGALIALRRHQAAYVLVRHDSTRAAA